MEAALNKTGTDQITKLHELKLHLAKSHELLRAMHDTDDTGGASVLFHARRCAAAGVDIHNKSAHMVAFKREFDHQLDLRNFERLKFLL